ncbi:MAG: four helix bundle protein [Chloroflexi bacterium]|nr:four helix bundle protein [Chloroflexota bacterium]
MSKIERFEDLLCWQKARVLANAVYDLTERPKFSRDGRLRGQLQGAAGSVMHNIAEGFDSGSKPEFIRFLKMSRRSASEVQSELYLATDRSYITEQERQTAYDVATEAKRLINGMINHLRGKSKRDDD